MNRHLLIIGAGGDMQPRLRRLADGLTTTVICRASVLPWIKEVGENAAVVVLADDSPLLAWLAAARAVHSFRPVDAVVSLADIDQEKAAAAAADLGLDFHSEETVAATKDKVLMRRLLAERGGEKVPHRLVESLEDLSAFWDEVGGPLVVKPSCGRASVGICVVRNRTELPAAFERTSTATAPRTDPSTPMAERYVEGREFSVEAISHRGVHHMFAVTEKFHDPATKVEIGHVIPARITRDEESQVIACVRWALDALGVTFGITHTEIILGDDAAFLVETHLRPAGDNIDQLVADAAGADIIDVWLRQWVGEDVAISAEMQACRERPRYVAAAAIWYLAPDLHGILDGLDGWEAVERAPGVRVAERLLPDGAELTGLGHSFARLGYARTRARGPDEALRLAREALADVVVRSTP